MFVFKCALASQAKLDLNPIYCHTVKKSQRAALPEVPPDTVPSLPEQEWEEMEQYI